MTVAAPQTVLAPKPLWPGQSRWQFTLHQRLLSASPLAATSMMELVGAHGRNLQTAWNTPSTLQFSIDGRSAAASYIQELTTEVVAWRVPETGAAAQPMFRGVVAQTEDEISVDRHTITVTCHDRMAELMRRYLTSPNPLVYSQLDQDNIVINLVNMAINMAAPFQYTDFLPLQVVGYNPTGGTRGFPGSGVRRDRTYQGGQSIGQAIDDLSRVSSGFDWTIICEADNGYDYLAIWYPNKGRDQTYPILMYGQNVQSVTRSVNSADYANYWRSAGNNGQSDPTQPQLIGEAWNNDATDATHGIGLWQAMDDASDVTIQQTLIDKANGDLLLNGQLVPQYTLELTPGTFKEMGTGVNTGLISIGDTFPLVIQSGRLNVSTIVRILGIEFDIGDDGDETVKLTVGRPQRNLADLMWEQQQAIQALNRR